MATTLLRIPAGHVELSGDLVVPAKVKGLVLFSHGSGSSRLSPRNNYVANILQEGGFATLLFDLLTEAEDQLYANRFDIRLLANRLEETTRWILEYPTAKGLPLGYFGASTGAASALKAAADLGDTVKAIVSRGGRPDLAMSVLADVQCPTLLIVGSLDTEVIRLNQQAFEALSGIRQLEIVAGATHLFAEPGKLKEVANLAAGWFTTHLK